MGQLIIDNGYGFPPIYTEASLPQSRWNPQHDFMHVVIWSSSGL